MDAGRRLGRRLPRLTPQHAGRIGWHNHADRPRRRILDSMQLWLTVAFTHLYWSSPAAHLSPRSSRFHPSFIIVSIIGRIAGKANRRYCTSTEVDFYAPSHALHKMQAIATDRVVCLCVCLLVTFVSPVKWLNRSRCNLGNWLEWVQRTMYWMGSESPKKRDNFWVVRPTETHR